MLRCEDYCIGWLCAVGTEHDAACAFLDEEHAAPDHVHGNDQKIYTLGRIGIHNVVIAVTPRGKYGKECAAAVARDMLYTFPKVRIGLAVGIAGGVPSHEHDIRLGDVVVGRKVQQYDLVGILSCDYEIHGHQLEHAINTVLEKKPSLRRKFQRPGPATDRLYLSNIVHPAKDDRDCVEACGQDHSQLLHREPRTNICDDDPTIHIGLIGSTNTVVKDAVIRDAAAKHDILCFEMEAADLMKHFPCLVIRGISNYSDSHEYRQWQGYAAMTAAAYAKDLLLRMPHRG